MNKIFNQEADALSLEGAKKKKNLSVGHSESEKGWCKKTRERKDWAGKEDRWNRDNSDDDDVD